MHAENGSEYIAKGPAFNSALPYVAANELVAALLASTLALPILDYTLIEHTDHLFFGSTWIQKGRQFYPGLTRELFHRAANMERCYDIAAFDYWICNTDRHAHNLLLRKEPLGGSLAELLVLNDHSHALIQAGSNPEDMHGYTSLIPPLHLDFLREAIVSHSHLRAAISLIEGVTDAMIASVCAAVPDAFLTEDRMLHVERFLCARRDALRSMFNASLVAFPGLGGRKL